MSSTASPATPSALANPSPSRESANNHPSHSPHHSSRPKKTWLRRYASTGVIALGVLAAAATLVVAWTGRKSEPFNGPLWTAKYEVLQLSIVERGTLESAENSEIVCRVKASGKGSTISTTIKWIIDDGTQVVRGQKLIELDDSGLQDQLKDQNIKVIDAEAKYDKATNDVVITQTKNKSLIQTAITNHHLARLELEKYLGERIGQAVLKVPDRVALAKFLANDLDGQMKKEISESKDKSLSAVLQMLDDIDGRIQIARADYEQWLERTAWSNRMVRQGFLSRSQADQEQARLESSKINLRKVEGELGIYKVYDIGKTVTKLWSDVTEFQRAIDLAKTEADSTERTAESDYKSKLAVFLQERSKQQDIEDEIRKCTIHAPHDGMVVYFLPETNRGGGGGGGSSVQQGLIAQGEAVREGQKMIRIPNLSHMLVNTRIHEAMVSRLKGEVTKQTGFSEALQGAFSIGRRPLDLAVNHAVFLAEIKGDFKKKDVVVLDPGQRAFVRIDAKMGKIYPGRVKTVATMAAASDFFTADVKVYQTMVSIDGVVEDLKPGYSAEVTIIADETNEPVLTIPMQSVVGSIAMGAERKAYVIDEHGQPKLVDITVGASNDRMVQILKGINEGDRVVLNPRALLDEKSGLKPANAPKQRGVDVDEVKSKKGKKGGGGGAGGGPGGPQGGFQGPGNQGFKKGLPQDFRKE
jgi:HlyD family secretion protein